MILLCLPLRLSKRRMGGSWRMPRSLQPLLLVQPHQNIIVAQQLQTNVQEKAKTVEMEPVVDAALQIYPKSHTRQCSSDSPIDTTSYERVNLHCEAKTIKCNRQSTNSYNRQCKSTSNHSILFHLWKSNCIVNACIVSMY